jgi:hypothetical protein
MGKSVSQGGSARHLEGKKLDATFFDTTLPSEVGKPIYWRQWAFWSITAATSSSAGFAARRSSHSSNDIANKGGLLDRLIPRERLRPRYGEGWRSP